MALPDLPIDMTINNSSVGLAAGGYDLSLRLGDVLDSGLVAVPIGNRLHPIVVASPSYLETHPAIKQPEDLS